MKRRSKNRLSIRNWPVMPAMCASCPFGPNGNRTLANAVLGRTLLQASQRCHHPRLQGGPETHLCRGARDAQLTVLHRMGLLDEPTDAAFAAKSKELGVGGTS